MAESLWDAIKRKASELDWSLYNAGNGNIEFSKYSPAGEDFFIVVSASDLVADVRSASDGFDAEEHVRGLLNAKANGFGGVPDAKTLAEDAEAIQEMLEELADALEEVEENEQSDG